MARHDRRSRQTSPVCQLRQRPRRARPVHRVRDRARADQARASGGGPPMIDTLYWTPVCRVDDLLPERGAAVLVGTRQVAVFRAFSGDLYALGNLDPFSGAYVLSRGIVGTRGAEPTVASPMHKEVFSLVTGVCLDDPGIS